MKKIFRKKIFAFFLSALLVLVGAIKGCDRIVKEIMGF